MSFPTTLGMKNSGQNATTVVSTAKMTGPVMRRVPRMDASTPRQPFSRSA